MADLPQQTVQNKSAERFFMQRMSTTREQAIRKLSEFRNTSQTATALTQAKQIQSSSGAPITLPKAGVTATQVSFPPRAFIGDSVVQQPNTPSGGSGFTGNITVCVDDGEGGFTTGTAVFQAGSLISVET